MVCSVSLLKMVAKPFLWGLPKYERTKNSKHSKRLLFFLFSGRLPGNEKCLLGVSQTLIRTEEYYGKQKEKNPNEIWGDSRGKRADNGDLPLRYNHGFSLFGKLPCMVATIK